MRYLIIETGEVLDFVSQDIGGLMRFVDPAGGFRYYLRHQVRKLEEKT